MFKTGLFKVTEDDCDLLFNWRNEKEVIKYSFYDKPIEYNEHIDWFNNEINTNDYFYIYYSDGIPVGTICGEIDDGNISDILISYSIEKMYRGLGFGKKIIQLFEEKMPSYFTLMASVKKDNIASIKIFESLGYKKYEYDNFYEFTKRIK
jgi:RimJ/RimL family protein N-acetyltransferase